MIRLAALLALPALMLAPFFGRQAMRLIRESWGGILRPNRSGDLVERGATELAEELTAMFGEEVPLEHSGPVTINNAGDGPALTLNLGAGDGAFPGIVINGATGRDSLDLRGGGGLATDGDINVGGGTVTIGDGSTINLGDVIVRLPDGSTLDPAGLGESLTRRAYVGRVAGGSGPGYSVDLYERGAVLATVTATGTTSGLAAGTWIPAVIETRRTIRAATEAEDGAYVTDYEFALDQTGGSTSVFLGRVTGGSGDTYTVDLYGDGPDEDATASVTATVPQIDADETIPEGTWIAAVHRFENVVVDIAGNSSTVVTYSFQPPVWA